MTPGGDTHTAWHDRTLDERFRSIDKEFEDLDKQIRAIAPVVPDVYQVKETAATLRRDVDELRVDMKAYVNRSVTKQLAIVVTPMFFSTVALLIALFFGKL